MVQEEPDQRLARDLTLDAPFQDRSRFRHQGLGVARSAAIGHGPIGRDRKSECERYDGH